MDIQSLGKTLAEMYNKAPEGRQATHIHLFGIKYADIIRNNHYSVKEIVAYSGLKASYAAEVNKGINLSEYVVPKN